MDKWSAFCPIICKIEFALNFGYEDIEMPLLLTQKLKEMTYNDKVGELYHYPKEYWSYIRSDELFIYYHPWENGDKKQYYFGVGRIGDVYQDPEDKDARYAEIIDYSPFEKNIHFKDENGEYLEKREGKGEHFFRSVRVIDDAIFNRIINRATLAEPITRDTYHHDQDTDSELKDFNQEYQNLTPQKYDRLVSVINRPTRISDKLKSRANYTCQICGEIGFEKKSGKKYIEAHHIIELHQMVEGSLVTDNVLIVCSTCHRKLHYANVKYDMENRENLRITINGKAYNVKRNLI